MRSPLLARLLKHHARLLASLVASLFGFEVLIVWAAAQIEMGPGLRRMLEMIIPPEARELLAAQFSVISFSGAVGFGFQHPVALAAGIAYVVVVATVPAGERESGFLDLVLSRPVRRYRCLLAPLALVSFGALLMPLAQLAGVVVGLALVEVPDELPWWRYVVSAMGLSCLLLAVGGYTILFASGSRRRGPAAARAVALTLALFVLEFLADFWSPAARVRWLSPFHYFKPAATALSGSIPLGSLAVLLAIFVVGSAVALVRFQRQDL